MGRDDTDDLDDLLDDRKAELEARFRELEREAEIEKLRAEAGRDPTDRGRAEDASPAAGRGPRKSARGAKREAPPPRDSGGAGPDPLASMKAALDSDAPVEKVLVVLCPHCDAKNRVSVTRLRTGSPVCGRCKRDLAVPR